MSDGLSALFWGIITFSLLVLIHEGGHFAAARMFGVKVHEFMIGLPGPALRLHGKKTVYGITAIPLGGYVRIAGMEPGPENPLLGPALAAATRRGTIDADQLARGSRCRARCCRRRTRDTRRLGRRARRGGGGVRVPVALLTR